MKTTQYLLFAAAGVVCATGLTARPANNTVGTHHLELVEPGKAQRLLSIPYLRVATSRGRLDGVDLSRNRLIDHEFAFADLSPDSAYIVLIGSGAQAGHWFLVDSAPDSASAGIVDHAGMAGDLRMLAGDELFSVHKLFTLAELFGNDGSLLEAGASPKTASRLNFYRGSSYEEYWLSDGTMAPEGWTISGNDGYESVGHSAILPGMSFFITHPNPVEPISIRIQGAVSDVPIHLPLVRGYNFVAPLHSRSLFAESGPSLEFEVSGLIESGFLQANAQGGGDKLLIFDNDRSKITDTVFLDAGSQTFRSITFGANEPESYGLEMGEGVILLNTQGAYTWRFPGD